MSGKLKVSINESIEELEKLLHQASTATQKERLQMLYWLKRSLVNSRKQLASLLHRNERTLYEWLYKYKQGGISGLLEVQTAPGKAAKIPAPVLEQLQQKLREPKGFESYREVQQWLAQDWGIEVSYPTAHRVVRYQLNSKLKALRPYSTQAESGRGKAPPATFLAAAAAQEAFKKTSLTP